MNNKVDDAVNRLWDKLDKAAKRRVTPEEFVMYLDDVGDDALEAAARLDAEEGERA